MIKMLCKIPKSVNIAFSGGVDSLAIFHFLRQGRKDIRLLHFNHGCQYSDTIEAKCRRIAEAFNTEIIVGNMAQPQQKGESKEAYWRKHRYNFLNSFGEPYMTCHHLDDACETWLFSAIHGTPKLIPTMNGLIYRPFLTTPKQEFVDYCQRHGYVPVDDAYNSDLSLTRNHIRANIIPEVLKVNPGFHSVIRKKYESRQICNKV